MLTSFLLLTFSIFSIKGQAQTSSSNSSSQANSSSFLNVSSVPIDTSCYRNWIDLYGASQFNLTNNLNYIPTVTYFNQKDNIQTMPNFQGQIGQQIPGIQFIKACGTLMRPITDLGIQTAVFDTLTNTSVYLQSNVILGDPGMPTKNNDTTSVGDSQTGKFCSNLTLTYDDQLVLAEIQSYRNEITQLRFETSQGKSLTIGQQLRNTLNQIIYFNSTNGTIVGLRGTLTQQPASPNKILSQLSFVIWYPTCFSKDILVYGSLYLLLIALSSVLVICICIKKRKDKIKKNQVTPEKRLPQTPGSNTAQFDLGSYLTRNLSQLKLDDTQKSVSDQNKDISIEADLNQPSILNINTQTSIENAPVSSREQNTQGFQNFDTIQALKAATPEIEDQEVGRNQQGERQAIQHIQYKEDVEASMEIDQFSNRKNININNRQMFSIEDDQNENESVEDDFRPKRQESQSSMFPDIQLKKNPLRLKPKRTRSKLIDV